ncbi:MAG TPA: GNAT family N-acetyltransferase, partial [Fimbriimonadaceae bacterium]|nr:GNAT family N-acetyltransferase [Fimbriimonadaceae bacterium]
LEKIDVEGPNCVYCAVRDQKVYGFALLQRSSDKLPIGGAVWRNSLGEIWGSLGPIGIAKELRGNGLGHGLLGKALEHLRDLGVRRCIIDWTTLDAFYGRHGFEIARRYRPSQLRISD